MTTTSASTKQWIHADDYASPALLELLDMQLTKPIVEYIVEQVVDAVEFSASAKQPRSSFFNGRNRRRDNSSKHVHFATEVLSRSRATMPTILATLVYIDRVRPRLHIMCEDFAFERVFLGALIVARKFIHDCNYRCKHWASFTGVFGPRDISRIEREFLEVLQFDLTFSEKDLLAHHDQLSGCYLLQEGLRSLHGTNPLSPASSPFGGSSSDSSYDTEDSMSPPTPPPAPGGYSCTRHFTSLCRGQKAQFDYEHIPSSPSPCFIIVMLSRSGLF
ncbi:hypothetical protein DL96DRAFT_1811510 [Flagelloscypha sp. PMI_526]|nr:hypothetical protein DL96DRAFT_1811510 [Flagelloscypha sp. PMI_526]